MSNSTFAHCRGGKLCNESDSTKIQENLSKWATIRKAKEPRLDERSPYWKQQSVCAAL